MSVLAVDIGSSRTKALLADWDGQLLDVRSRPTPRQHREPGEWSFPPGAVADVVEELIAAAAAQAGTSVDTLVFSCLGTAMAPVDADGAALGPALAPADRRPQAELWRLDDLDLEADELVRRTGSDPSAPSSLLHLLWWQAVHPHIVERTHRFRSLRGYVAARLGEVDAEDRSWASRTMLYDLDGGDWSPPIVAATGLPTTLLPPLAASTTTFPLRAAVVERLGLAPGARLVLGAMDNGCSLFGAAGPGRSGLVNIVGTFEHLAGTAPLSTVRSVAERAPAVIHAYLQEGRCIAMTRLALGDLLARLTAASGSTLAELLDGLSETPTGGRIGLTPDAIDEALAHGRPPGAVAQALLESASAPLLEFAQAWAAAGLSHAPIAVVGGGARDRRVLKLKASLLGRPLVTLASDESAGLGALRLAAMAVTGATADEACRRFDNPVKHTIDPAPTASAVQPTEVPTR